ncbi:MAG: FprA family A-type flavoprotein [Lachnospiraceae bacterium]|nr:FprA family A-type flavoprotein [Lachnospiraceae bacterium]
MDISEQIRYVGCDDRSLDLFESQYPIPNGVSYNSYVILDEKIAIMDTVDKRAGEEWLKKVEKLLGEKTPDYLVVHHLEPDHSANIGVLADRYPKMQIVLTAKAAAMLPQFFDQDLSNRLIQVKEGDSLSLGSHTLHFILAPMVHWPEVMVSYEDSEKVLFSADGFGTFGAISENLPWIREARRYFINIVGKYGPSVQGLLKKAAALDIETIAPLHGPVLSDKLEEYIGYYDTWSRYEAEEEGILIPYASAHGNTKEAALFMADLLEKAGQKVIPMDLNREDMAKAVENAFRYDRMILAAITYDGALFPAMEDFLYHLEIKNFQKRKVGIIENGSWGPLAGKKMREHLESMKEIEIVEPVVTIRTRRQSKDQAQFEALRDAML